MSVHRVSGDLRGKKRASGPLELELQLGFESQIQLLGAEFGSFLRVALLLTI